MDECERCDVGLLALGSRPTYELLGIKRVELDRKRDCQNKRQQREGAINKAEDYYSSRVRVS